MKLKIIYLLLFSTIFGCNKQENIVVVANEIILTKSTWMIQKSSGKGGSYDYSFDRESGLDPFQFAQVRIKLEANGSITGIDNNGKALKNATWKYNDTEKTIEISGTGIFGIDGTLQVLTLQAALVEVKNTLKVPQLNATIDLKATLVPAK